MRKLFLLLLFFPGLMPDAYPQEVLHPLQRNIHKAREAERLSAQPSSRFKSAEEIRLSLPFREDFSHPGPWPDSRLWSDSFVYVNTAFAVHPKTVGVATFDALDAAGNIYEHATANNRPFAADQLSSRAIRLDSVFEPGPARLIPADSVMLSFYFQPQGRGGAPLAHDSLVLQFLHTPGHYILDDEGNPQWQDDLWQSVWQAQGQSLSAFSQDSFPYFKRVIIPITDTTFFREDFRFRFVNHASFPIPTGKNPPNIGGQRSIWNIDYILLDRHRGSTDSAYYDLAFAAPAPSPLRHYTSMPWSHFIVNPTAHMRTHFDVAITNLNNIGHNYTYRYFSRDEGGRILRNYVGGGWNIAPFTQAGYQAYQPHARPIVVENLFGSPLLPATERRFDIVHALREGTAGDGFTRNDTIVHQQYFGRYFAYDDGIPESTYGLLGRDPRVASRFVASHADTLHEVHICFNQILGDESAGEQAFRIMVWRSIHPREEILYESDPPVFSRAGEDLHGFTVYRLDQAVLVSDTFYVGVAQEGTIGERRRLHMGFDRSNNASDKLFINYAGVWEPSIQRGALMLRPVFGQTPVTAIPTHPRKEITLQVYPNPLRQSTLHLQPGALPLPAESYQIEIVDLLGRRLLEQPYSHSLDLGHLPRGVYILRLRHPSGRHSQAVRFVVAR